MIFHANGNESVTLIQAQYKGGAFKGFNEGRSPKADFRLTASIGRNRPIADIRSASSYSRYRTHQLALLVIVRQGLMLLLIIL